MPWSERLKGGLIAWYGVESSELGIVDDLWLTMEILVAVVIV